MGNWIVWPEDWMAQGNRSMNSYVEGAENWAVECSEITQSMEHRIPNWKDLLDQGYRYYVLKFNVIDYNGTSYIDFYRQPNVAQKAFELARDPMFVHH